MNMRLPCPNQGCKGGKVYCLVGFDIFRMIARRATDWGPSKDVSLIMSLNINIENDKM
jgi:hypothetical protein